MNILLLGANGQLGRSFVSDGGLGQLGRLTVATRDGKSVNGGSAETVDFADPSSLARLLDRVNPQIIVNAAGYTAVDRAEQEEALATRVNAEAVGLIGEWAAKHGALVVHYSTDYVFSGDSPAPYPVDAPTAPIGAYGRSKLAGEQALRASGAAHLIFRTAWVYSAHGHNFLRTMLRLGKERDEVSVVDDQHGSPTSTSLIVRGSLAALTAWLGAAASTRPSLEGLHHLVAGNQATWREFASAIFERAVCLGLLTSAPRVRPIASSDFPTLAKRPAWSVLDNTRFTQQFGIVLPDWREDLEQVLSKLVDEKHAP